MDPPLITLEEHFFSSAASTSETISTQYSEQFKHIPNLLDKLTDLSTLRLSQMDLGHVSFQIISHAPGSLTASECQSANDQLFSAIRAHPDRFAGFAVLPMSDPVACAAELTRCVTELGFVGALVDNHTPSGGYYDDEAYLPFWTAASDLDVPIYLHPTWPTATQLSTLYTGNFSRSASKSISASAFGWHSDVATHVLRLVASGLFDRLPALKVVIGHMGEMLPFMLGRIAQLSVRWTAAGPEEKDDDDAADHPPPPPTPFKDVWDRNIWITTSGNWSVDPMATILRNTKMDRILYSVDYPFAKNEDGLEFVRDLATSGLVTEDQLEMIAFRNAEKLFGVKAVKRF
ncbi:hypothetical protein PV08_11484 [Exophiala spinifera]|uniref:Amidohydrolase-related domain-containing protein n=1 Tax=Exophiala spinifera TaxID=91928 RepID=A0A0D2AVT8_9EURO|nr:uncharacterized protein PV08_11484 [Exophiala spinifera]KIW10520.1 hypothetical protein PV08_11484 [Exophiala spinifera]